jgi:hypothetical protein
MSHGNILAFRLLEEIPYQSGQLRRAPMASRFMSAFSMTSLRDTLRLT